MNETNSDNKTENKVTLKIGELPFAARESFNMLRGNIQMSGANVKTIAVTSPLIHEGKSSISVRLAYSMAALDKKTVFVDCDIRNSNFKGHYAVGKSGSLGLSGYLCGLCNVENAITHTQFEYLDVIMTGRIAPNPSELISSDLFSKLLEELKEKYDYVIVDTPPVNTVIDGVIAAKQCDVTVLVLESTRSERKQAIHAKQQLEYSGSHIIGCVLNKADNTDHKYGYGYSKKYGYAHKYGYYDNDSKYGYEDKSREKLHKSVSKEEKKKKRNIALSWIAYFAALIIVLAGIGYLLLQSRKAYSDITDKISELSASEGITASYSNNNTGTDDNETETEIVISGQAQTRPSSETETTTVNADQSQSVADTAVSKENDETYAIDPFTETTTAEEEVE